MLGFKVRAITVPYSTQKSALIIFPHLTSR